MSNSKPQKKFNWFAIVGVVTALFIAMLLVTRLLNPSIQTSLKDAESEQLGFVKGDTLSHEQINKLVLGLRTNDATSLKTLIKKNPEFFNSLKQQINSISVVDKSTPNDESIYHAELLALVFELRLSIKSIKQNLTEQSNLDLESLFDADITKPFAVWLENSRDIENLTHGQERLLAEVVKHKASFPSENTGIDTRYFVSRYKHEKLKHSKQGLFTTGLLQASWLKQAALKKYDFPNVWADFKKIKPALKSGSDLLRLLNHKNKFVVITSAELITLYLPENAIHAIRFQLIRSNDINVKVALLGTLSAYGTQARSATKQLKRLLRVTKSDLVREKINETINRLNGRSKESKTKDA